MKYLFPILIVISSLSLFIITNSYFDGYLKYSISLGREIQSNADSLYHFNIASKAPFKFRILFSSIVSSSYDLIANGESSDLFFRVYKFWSGVFYVLATLFFYYLLRLNYSKALSLVGVLFFLSMPPMMLAFTVPVHTREDTLAYVILFVGLILILRQNFWGILIVSIIGAFCRETLLLLPLLYSLFSNEKRLRKVLILFVPIGCWLLFRFLNQESYDYKEGLRWNISNPIQVVGFLFITFNVLWLLLVGSLLEKRSSDRSNVFLSFFFRSFLMVFLMILLSTFVGGIFNEIRLLYLLAPWVIILSLEYIENNWNKLLDRFSLRYYQIYALLILLLVLYFQFSMPLSLDKLVDPGKFSVSYSLWFRVSLIYVGLFIIAVPAVFSISFLTKNREY